MSNDPVGRPPGSAGLHSKLRLAALAAVIAGVVLLATAAFVLSYEGIHQIALQAGVSPGLAKLYPLIFDAMLVIAAAAALALRGASWWARCYAWASLLILLVAVAAGNAVHATGTTLPAQPTKIAVAITPWVLLLMAFGLLLEMLRHFRTTRSAAGKATAAPAASGSAAAGVNGGPQTAVTRAGASGGKVHALPRVDLDTLLGPRPGQPPPIEVPHDADADGHLADPVSYGEETGYVHPDSYLDEGEYSPHGDTGGPESHAGQAGDNGGDGTRLAGHDAAAAEAPAADAESLAAAAESPGTAAESPGTAAESPATPAEAPATAAEAPTADAESLAAAAEAPATAASSAEPALTTADPAQAPATAAASSADPALTTADPALTTADPAVTQADPAVTQADPAVTQADPALTTADPAQAPAGEAGPAAENGGPAGGSRAAAKTPAGDGQGGDGVAQETADAEPPALERIRSTPTRPE